MGVAVSQGFCNKLLQTRHLKTAEMYSLAGLETRSSQSRCQQGHTSPEVLEERWLHVSLLASGGSQKLLAFLSSLFLHPIPASAFARLSFSRGCLGLQFRPLERTPPVTELVSTLIQEDLVFPWWHLRRPSLQIRSQSQVPGVRAWMYFWWNTIQPHNNVEIFGQRYPLEVVKK